MKLCGRHDEILWSSQRRIPHEILSKRRKLIRAAFSFVISQVFFRHAQFLTIILLDFVGVFFSTLPTAMRLFLDVEFVLIM